MERLWAPWRMTYIAGIDKKEQECVFCTKPAESDDRGNLIIHRGRKCFVIMNRFPYNNGHLMVIPYAHLADISQVDSETSTELWEVLCLLKRSLAKAFNPDGFNIGMNLGRTAGAGIDQHLHLHLVPRWNGDTNFMPVLGEVKVISQALEETYDALLAVFRSTAGIS